MIELNEIAITPGTPGSRRPYYRRRFGSATRRRYINVLLTVYGNVGGPDQRLIFEVVFVGSLVVTPWAKTFMYSSLAVHTTIRVPSGRYLGERHSTYIRSLSPLGIGETRPEPGRWCGYIANSYGKFEC